jgi:serine/threonine-protein kinase
MSAVPSPSPDVDDDDVVAIGSVLDGRYRIDGVLGRGGMGMVYQGEHVGLGRAVAIKVLHADLGTNREAAARFQREALASGRLDHPNIVVVMDFGVLHSGACYLVMEKLEGEPLSDRLDRDGALPWRTAALVMREMLHALGHAHDKGVVHRDIKPDNIFIAHKEGAEVVKLVDFGIAKLYAGGGDDPAATRSGMTVGTPAYLSPEQAVGGEITPASDLYSASVVLFEMVAGRPPFVNSDPVALLTSHVGKPVPAVRDVAPAVELPPAFEALIRDGLAKLVVDRVASAGEYLARLDELLAAPDAPAADGVVVAAVAPAAEPTTPLTGEAPVVSLLTAELGVAPTASFDSTPLPMPARAVSIADLSEPLPRRWIGTGAAVIGGAIVLAIVMSIVSHCGGKATSLAPVATAPTTPPRPAAAPRPPAPPVKVATVERPPTPIVVPVPTPALTPTDPEPTIDDDTRLKAAYHDLDTGKTCTARKAAVAALRALGDPRAIPALRAARYRMRGGVLGLGEDNTNACLKADAEAAIRALTPRKPAPAPR